MIMNLFKLLLCLGVVLTFFYVIGLGIKQKLRLSNSYSVLACGAITIIGGFEIIALPFMYNRSNFFPLYVLTISLIIILLVLSLYLIWKNRKSYAKISFHGNWCLVCALIIIFLQIIGYVVLWHSDADDSFYVAQTTSILSSGRIQAFEPSTGNVNWPLQSNYALVGWELFIAVICRLFNINAAFMSHTIIPIIFLIVNYSVSYSIVRKFSEKNADCLFLMYVIINMFCGYAVYSRGAFLLFRLGQGKADLVNCVMPFVLFVFLDMVENKRVSFSEVIMLTLAVYAGFCTSTVGLYDIVNIGLHFFLKNVRPYAASCSEA